jgi:hypothetical protein
VLAQQRQLILVLRLAARSRTSHLGRHLSAEREGDVQGSDAPLLLVEQEKEVDRAPCDPKSGVAGGPFVAAGRPTIVRILTRSRC